MSTPTGTKMETATMEGTEYSLRSREVLEYGIGKVHFEIIALKLWMNCKREAPGKEVAAAAAAADEDEALETAQDAQREAVRLTMFALPAVELAVANIFTGQLSNAMINCWEIELLTLDTFANQIIRSSNASRTFRPSSLDLVQVKLPRRAMAISNQRPRRRDRLERSGRQ